MAESFKIIKEDASDLTQKIKYIYLTSNNPIDVLIEKGNAVRISRGKEPIIKKDNMSDFEVFKQIFPYQYYQDINNYYLIANNIPVTLLSVIKKDNNDVELSFATSKNYKRHGYATKAVELMEQLLFKDENVKDIIMVDVSKHGETTMIANALGYTKIDRELRKRNPNYKEKIR